MGRLWLGVGLLILLLLLGLWVSAATADIHRPLAESLRQAEEAALSGDWGTAEACAQDAYARWARTWQLTAAIADHTPMDEIDGLFAQLPVYARVREAEDFSAACAELSRRVRAMGDAHSLTWWNLL